jgi:tRNA A37 N6-isopentenylltransferase MiaA
VLVTAGDPATAGELKRNDYYRLTRALEIVNSGAARGTFEVPKGTVSTLPPYKLLYFCSNSRKKKNPLIESIFVVILHLETSFG